MNKVYLLASIWLVISCPLISQHAVNGQSPFSGPSAGDLAFTSSIGGTLIGTAETTNNGQRTFRLVTNNESNVRVEVGPSGCSGNLNIGTLDGSQITGVRPCSNGSFITKGVSRTYVFKTQKANQGNQFVFWRLLSPVRQVTSVTSSVSAGVSEPHKSVAVTARLGTVGETSSNRQTMYIRYSDDNFLSSYVVAMASNGNGTFTGNIPGEGLTAGETVRYYVFSSGSGSNNPAVTVANADLRTISFNNNGGSNYSFLVASTLPVTYASWAGTRVQDAVKLQWKTATEAQADYFTIERSNNGGLKWQTVGEVRAENSPEGAGYTFTDPTAPAGDLQYRLKQVDFDGAYHLSHIIGVKPAGAEANNRLQIWPQPAPASAIQLRAVGQSGNQANLYTAAGERIISFTLTGDAQPLPTADLPKGIYFLRVDGDQGRLSRRLLVE